MAFIENTSIEIIRPLTRSTPVRHVLFDFDGTLSLIREGWPSVMIPMLVEIIRESTETDEDEQELEQLVSGFVSELTGKQTIYQMIRLAEEVGARGGTPKDPVDYKNLYHDRLMDRIAGRREDLVAGRVNPRDMVVPYSFELLEDLSRRDVALYIASGTDEAYVVEEARLLGIDRYVGSGIHGAQDDYRSFSKQKVIRRILDENEVDGEALLVFGDGYVEIQDGHDAGAVTVAVASDEAGRSGEPDQWKRRRLIDAGADIVIPDYREYRRLIDYIWAAGTDGGQECCGSTIR